MANDKYSANALLKFLIFAAEKGMLKRATAENRRNASKRILDILEIEEKNDLRNIGVEKVFNRFQNLKGHEISPSSLNIYKSRFKASLTDFLSWADNPSAFKTASATRSRKKDQEDGADRTGKSTPPKHHINVNDIAFPIPIREGVVVTISNIPNDLTEEEAKKIAAVVQALAT